MLKLIKSIVKKIITSLYKVFGVKIEKAFSYFIINFRLISKNIYFYQPLYKLNTKFLFVSNRIERECEDRWSAIESHIDGQPTSFMDIGSQFGYFVLRMAEKGYFSLGVEREDDSIWLSNQVRNLSGLSNANFVKIDITPETILGLPTVDVVSCMSIFHHWAGKNHDLEYANQIMIEIAKRTKKMLFFDTGQSNENATWSEKIDFMKPSPKKWIQGYLNDLGFSQVIHLGDFDAIHISSQKRHLFLAIK